MLAAGPKEKMGLMVQDSSLERQDKKQLKKIRNRKSTILPLVIRKAEHTFAAVGRINAEEKEAVSVDAEVNIWKNTMY